ncbi:SH3 and multiple ankyrin repeat domains protein 1 [Nymphon striatum]|nr:SH3 and multiple ankyrin repeat domains protein 1 [Nymphon striatum]
MAYRAGRPVDLNNILNHELMKVPVSIADTSGTLRTGTKSILFDVLTKDVSCPTEITISESSCLIIDGQAMIMSLGKPAYVNTFGEYADVVVKYVLKQREAYNRIDVTFDRYNDLSIKGDTRVKRTKKSRPIRRLIEDDDVPLPNKWTDFMASTDNKGDLCLYLSNALATAPSEKTIIVGGGFASETEVRSTDANMNTDLLERTHEEADTRVVLHCIHSNEQTIVVTARDTDILILLVAHFNKLTCSQLWLKAGTSKKPKYVPIHDIRKQLGFSDQVYETIPAFHAITGCDAVSYFSGHSKKSAWNVFIEHNDLLKDLGRSLTLSTDVSDDAEKFICHIYKTSSKNCDQARVKLFSKCNAADSMPPSSAAAQYHIQRANYQSLVWIEACNPKPVIPSPTESGWKLVDGVLKPVLTSLPPIPKACKDIELRDCQNYGLFCPPSNGKAGKFLDEERPIADYPFAGPIGYFELKYKRRVYKMLKIDEKQIKQLHTRVSMRSNLKKMVEYVTTANHEKVSKMLNKGLDPNFQCVETGETLLSLTAGLKHPAKLIMLLANGGAILDYRTRDGKTALHRAVERNNYECLKTLLDLGASPNYKDSKGLTPLYYTVTQNADPKLCEHLLHDHSMIGVSDLQGWQEVHQSARNGMVQHLEHLLFYGADMNARNASGNTPLHVCAVNDQESCTRVLLFRGCDKEAMNFANQTPYQVAVIANNLHLADLIHKHDHIVLFREAPTYNPRRRASLAASVVSASLNRTHSDPRLELVLQTGIVLKPPSPSPSNRSLPPFSSASSSGETTCTETSSNASTVTTCTSSHCEDSEDTTSSSIMTDSSGVGTSMNSGGSYESSPYPEAIVSSGMTVVCVENHVDYNSPGHLKVYQGDILEVTGVTDCGLIEAVSRKGEHGFVPTSCIQEVKLRNPDSRSAYHSRKSRTEGRREMDTKKLTAIPRGHKMYGEPRTVILHKGKKGFGFVLRGAKAICILAASPLIEAPPCEDLPSLQYLEDVDRGGVADLAGLRKGDYLLEINGVDVTLVSHEQVVATIRNSGDLVAMTVVSPQSTIISSTPVENLSIARQCATLPRKLSGKKAPLPPKRDPATTLSVGRERAKSLVAGLAEMEALDRVMVDYDSEGRSTKSSSVESIPNKQIPKEQEQPKIASIRKRPGTQRVNTTKLEEMFNRQNSDDLNLSNTYNSYPSTPVKTPKVYASVAEMKRQKSKHRGTSSLLKLHHNFHSTPDLNEDNRIMISQNVHKQPHRHRSRSQSDLNSLNMKNIEQSWQSFAKTVKFDRDNTKAKKYVVLKPPPEEPPPPPPVGQIVKVDISKAHGDYASVTVANLKKEDVMSSFRPGDSAKLYASPETVVNVGIKNEQDKMLSRSRKYSTSSSANSRSNSLPPKIANGPSQLQNHPHPHPPPSSNNTTSSESENSGDSSTAIYSTFKNMRNRNSSNTSNVDSVSTDSGNSTDKGQFTKEKPLYAKPMLAEKPPYIPEPDYDMSETEEDTMSNGVEKPMVRMATWEEQKLKTSLQPSDMKKAEHNNLNAVQKENNVSNSTNKPVFVKELPYNKAVEQVEATTDSVTNNLLEKPKSSVVRKESTKPVEFRDDLAKKIAERHSKLVVVNSDQPKLPRKQQKVEIVDVKPGTMKDIIVRRKGGFSAGVEILSTGSVKKNISVFERKQDVTTKTTKVSDHRRSDGIRLVSDNENNSMKLSVSFPSDLSQEESSGVLLDAEASAAGASAEMSKPAKLHQETKSMSKYHPQQTENIAINRTLSKNVMPSTKISVQPESKASESDNHQNFSNVNKGVQRIRMGTGQALLEKPSYDGCTNFK